MHRPKRRRNRHQYPPESGGYRPAGSVELAHPGARSSKPTSTSPSNRAGYLPRCRRRNRYLTRKAGERRESIVIGASYLMTPSNRNVTQRSKVKCTEPRRFKPRPRRFRGTAPNCHRHRPSGWPKIDHCSRPTTSENRRFRRTCGLATISTRNTADHSSFRGSMPWQADPRLAHVAGRENRPPTGGRSARTTLPLAVSDGRGRTAHSCVSCWKTRRRRLRGEFVLYTVPSGAAPDQRGTAAVDAQWSRRFKASTSPMSLRRGARIFVARRTGCPLGGSASRARAGWADRCSCSRRSRRRANGSIGRSADGTATVPSACHRTVGLAWSATPAGPHSQGHQAGQRARERHERLVVSRGLMGFGIASRTAARTAGTRTTRVSRRIASLHGARTDRTDESFGRLRSDLYSLGITLYEMLAAACHSPPPIPWNGFIVMSQESRLHPNSG